MPAVIAEALADLQRPDAGCEQFVVKGDTPGRRKSRTGKLILVLKQRLEKEFWRITGVGWGDWSATEVGKKWGIETQFIQCSSPAIDNLSTDISSKYFYPEGGSFYWKWGGFLKLSLQIRKKKSSYDSLTKTEWKITFLLVCVRLTPEFLCNIWIKIITQAQVSLGTAGSLVTAKNEMVKTFLIAYFWSSF